jgi:hypothetical protein
MKQDRYGLYNDKDKVNIICQKCKEKMCPREFRINKTDLKPWEISIYFNCFNCKTIYEILMPSSDVLDYLDFDKIDNNITNNNLILDELVEERYVYYEINSLYDKCVNGCNSGIRFARKSDINTQELLDDCRLVLHRPKDYTDDQMWFEIKMFLQMIYDKLAGGNFDGSVMFESIQEMIKNYGKEEKQGKFIMKNNF